MKRSIRPLSLQGADGESMQQQAQRCLSHEVSLCEFIDGDHWSLFPLPSPARPQWKRLKSCRLRWRQKCRFQTWRAAQAMTKVLNQLDSGDFSNKLASSGTVPERQVKVTAARLLTERSILRAASLLVRERRGSSLTGVQMSPIASLLKMPLDEWGYIKNDKVKQVPMIADRMVEPVTTKYIDMLTALPEDDAIYYKDESNVVETNGKSDVLFKEIEERYGFIGGTKQEYLRYLHREDVQQLWSWVPAECIKATAGISTVLKKDGHKQRKLIMQCAANYAFQDPTDRANLGMAGGSALARCHVPSDSMAVSACDEDAAFTMVRVPDWMKLWQAGPPVLAHEVFGLLPKELQQRYSVRPHAMVSPCYVRLAMGGSHSVYILMRINLQHIGQTLFSHMNRLQLEQEQPLQMTDATDTGAVAAEEDCSCDDESWVTRQQGRRLSAVGQSGFTVDGWCEHVRSLKRKEHRTMVVMHFFAGDRRPGDVREWVGHISQREGLDVEVISIDLAYDPLWDLTCPSTFHRIMQLIEEGLIDIVIGGPPCWTVARSRHRALPGGGPRPLRFRWCVWGRQNLRPHERARLDEANTLWINYLAICEGVGVRGGAWLWEHPDDPGCSPFPSIWITDEMIGVEDRTGATRARLHQCAFGGISVKPTCFSGTLHGLAELDQVHCPGLSEQHWHGPSVGPDGKGGFLTRRLQSYPSELCRQLAERIVRTLLWMRDQDAGPTGALKGALDMAAPRITSWSTMARGNRGGVTMLNEASAKCFSTVISDKQSAVYVHVDDTVLISDSAAKGLHSDELLDEVVGGLSHLGFEVSQQARDGQLEKVVGYEVVKHPASFRLPLKKQLLLKEALLQVASSRRVQIDVLRSLVGMWIFGALLRRELLSIPHSVFHFMDEFQGETTTWWESARREIKAMAVLVPYMSCHVGSKWGPWLFATDAMGQNDVDFGGCGIVATPLEEGEVTALLCQGEAPGLTVARLDSTGGAKHPEKMLKPTVPFTMLPAKLFDEERWTEVERGRWKHGDHITIGESRTVVRLLRRIGAWPQLHGRTFFTLQDNRPTACSMSKGRSPSYQLNRVLRQKAAVCLAAQLRVFLPWVESQKQPADKSSRLW